MKIGILECGPTPPKVAARHGDFARMMARLFHGRGWTFEAFAAMDMHFPDATGDADAWLLTGSRYGAYDTRAFIPPLEGFIRRCAADGAPMMGICFGHQIIAQAMGGRVKKNPDGWTLGRQTYDFGPAGALSLTAWHQDIVTEAPEGAVVAATHPACAIAALRYPGWGATMQAHPEFDPDVTSALIEARRDDPDLPADRLAAATQAVALPLDSQRAADWLASGIGAAARGAQAG